MSNTPLTPAGWYPDPAGTANQRYWDGTAWTEHLAQPGLPAAGTGIVQVDLPEGARINTPFIWVMVLLPLVRVIAFALVDYQGILTRAVSAASDRSGAASLSLYTDPGYLSYMALSLVAYALTVVMGFLDSRALKRIGIVRPFPWGWAFISTVYIIGRTVVLRRRVHKGMAPLWIYIAVFVVSLIVSAIKITSAFAAILPMLSSAGLGSNA